MALRLPRTMRFDDTDTRVFERAAAAGEWAVSGAFAFADAAPESLAGKARQAFRNGFLGTGSFGWATFVAVADIDQTAFDGVVEALARHFVARYGAPDVASALPPARAEVEFAASLCDHKINTLLCVEREFNESGLVERFRVVEPRAAPAHARIWSIVEDGDAS